VIFTTNRFFNEPFQNKRHIVVMECKMNFHFKLILSVLFEKKPLQTNWPIIKSLSACQ